METEPEVVHTFRLGDDVAYVPTGVFKTGDVIKARWPVLGTGSG